MKYVGEFRRKKPAGAILEEIKKFSIVPASIMEICGTHTHSISKYGLRSVLPPNLKLLSGPGCPVCVTHQTDINRIVEFSRSEKSAIITTFGDMLRVPGSFSSLEVERARGADVRVVYSPLASLDIARKNPDREVVFYSVGFETTAPTVAATVVMASVEGIKNFSVFSFHKLTPPAMKALLDSGETRIDGFICPGHVTTVIGAASYGFIAKDYKAPCVVSGFEPLDVLYSLYLLLKQLKEKRSEIEIEYSRLVTWDGNSKAKAVMGEVFEVTDALWRGLGEIPASGLKMREEYALFDAAKRFNMEKHEGRSYRVAGCLCGSVLRGISTPVECRLFSNICTPESPVGPCMVSSEGTCAAYYMYERGNGLTGFSGDAAY